VTGFAAGAAVAAMVAPVVGVVLALPLAVVAGYPATTPSYVVLAAMWAVFCITTWWVMWGPRR